MPKQATYTATLTVNVTGENGQTRTFTKQVENMVRPKVGVLVEAGPFSGRATKVEWSDNAKSVTVENEADSFDEAALGEGWAQEGVQAAAAPAAKREPKAPAQA